MLFPYPTADERVFLGPVCRCWPAEARVWDKFRRCFGARAGRRADPLLDRSFAATTRRFERTCFEQTWGAPPCRVVEFGWVSRSYLSKRGGWPSICLVPIATDRTILCRPSSIPALLHSLVGALHRSRLCRGRCALPWHNQSCARFS